MARVNRTYEERKALEERVDYLTKKGYSERSIAKLLNISRGNVSQIKARLNAAEEEYPEIVRYAPPAKHTNQKVVIDGVTYTDITDYIVDCGGL